MYQDYIKANLPLEFLFKTSKDIIRLGNQFDGGYLVSQEDVLMSDRLISLGIGNDWSFEKDFTDLNNVPVFAFDGSVDIIVFMQKIIINMLRLNKPFRFISKIKILFSYLLFFRNKRKHIHKFVGNEIIFSSNHNDSTHISIKDVFATTNDSTKIFLKVDIEGGEYRILNEIIENQNRITGLAIEFHNCDINKDQIINFIKKFDLSLIHIHANNWGPVDRESGLPRTLEMSFSKSSLLDDNYILPHPLDSPNNPNYQDIVLSF